MSKRQKWKFQYESLIHIILYIRTDYYKLLQIITSFGLDSQI